MIDELLAPAAPAADMYPDRLLEEIQTKYDRNFLQRFDANTRQKVDKYFQELIADENAPYISAARWEPVFGAIAQPLHGYYTHFLTLSDINPYNLFPDPKIQLSEDETAVLRMLAYQSARKGVPLEQPDSALGHLVAIPVYDFDSNPIVLHGVFVIVKFCDTYPLKERDWLEALYHAATGLRHLFAAHAADRVQRYDSISIQSRNPNDRASWRDHVRPFLTREQAVVRVEEMARAGKTPKEMSGFLADAAWQLGSPDPYHLNPKRLFHAIEKAMNSGQLLAMTQSALQTSANLSSSVMSQTWVDTLHGVFGGLGAIIPDTEMVFFLASGKWRDFTLAHDLPENPSPAGELALQLVAQWAALTGQAVHDMPQDNRAVFQNLRQVLGMDVPVVAIPVYAWEVGHKNDPVLHGVFVAIRRANAPAPAPMVMTTWTLSAQYLLSPLNSAKEAGLFQYRPLGFRESSGFARDWGGKTVTELKEWTDELYKDWDKEPDG